MLKGLLAHMHAEEPSPDTLAGCLLQVPDPHTGARALHCSRTSERAAAELGRHAGDPGTVCRGARERCGNAVGVAYVRHPVLGRAGVRRGGPPPLARRAGRDTARARQQHGASVVARRAASVRASLYGRGLAPCDMRMRHAGAAQASR